MVLLAHGIQPFDVYAPFLYQDRVRAALVRYKFYNRPDLYRFFGDVMAATLCFSGGRTGDYMDSRFATAQKTAGIRPVGTIGPAYGEDVAQAGRTTPSEKEGQ